MRRDLEGIVRDDFVVDSAWSTMAMDGRFYTGGRVDLEGIVRDDFVVDSAWSTMAMDGRFYTGGRVDSK